MRSHAVLRSSAPVAGALALAFALPLMGACKPRTFNEGSGATQDAWNAENNPEWFSTAGVRLDYKFDKRKIEGKLGRQPWSETYWPDFAGGIAVRWQDPRGLHGGFGPGTVDAGGRTRTAWEPPPSSPHDAWRYALLTRDALKKMPRDAIARLSPAEKYDIYMGRYAGTATSYPLVKAERERTGHSSGGSNRVQSWWGLCHAWAPASLLYPEPGPVDVKNADGIVVPFGASDVKALLISYFNATNSASSQVYVGKRCGADGRAQAPQSPGGGAGSRSSCKDVNAGAWHILVTNLVRQDSPTDGFVFDMDDNIEVWNQPISSYTARYVENGKSHPGADPRTRRSVRVFSSIQYGKEVTPNWLPNTRNGKNSIASMQLEYLLEIDANGNIIGGEWVSKDFPDFVWYRKKPGSFAVNAGGVDFSGLDRLMAAAGAGSGGSSGTSTVASNPRPAQPTSPSVRPSTSTNPSTSSRPPASPSTSTGSVVVPTTPVFTDPFRTTSGGRPPVSSPGAGGGGATNSPTFEAVECAPLDQWLCNRAYPRCLWNRAMKVCYKKI